MAKNKEDIDIWNDDDGAEEPKKRPHRLRRFLIFFFTLVAVLGVVLLAAWRDGTGFDAVRRYFAYGTTESAGSSKTYRYDASASNRFAVCGDALVVLSDTALKVLDGDGTERYSVSVKMKTPALSSGGGRAVAYDVGGTQLYVVDAKGEVFTLTAQENEPFIAATLNKDGWLAVTAERKSYKGAVYVYNADMELVFEFRSSSRFVTDACVADDNATLAAVTLGQENSVFVSNIVLYSLQSKDPIANYDISDGLVLQIGGQGGGFLTVSDICVTAADRTGAVQGSYDYANAYLREFDLGGDGFTVLLLNRYQAGSVGRLVTVAPDGTELAAVDVNEEVLSLSAAGRYLAVLYADSLVIYNQDLQVYATLTGTNYAKSVLVRPDGSALLISSEKADLFLP